MQGRTRPTRKVRIQHRQPWLVEPLDFGPGDDREAEQELPPLVREWADTLANPATRRAYLSDVRGFLAHLGIATDQQLLVVRRTTVAAWRDHLARELESGRLTYQSCKRRMAAASSLYGHLNLQGHVIANPHYRVKRPPRPASERREGRRPASCPLSYCPAAGGSAIEDAAAMRNMVPRLLAKLEVASIGRQLTLW